MPLRVRRTRSPGAPPADCRGARIRVISAGNRVIVANRREGKVEISARAIFLTVFALIVSLGLMYVVWRLIGKLESDDHDGLEIRHDGDRNDESDKGDKEGL